MSWRGFRDRLRRIKATIAGDSFAAEVENLRQETRELLTHSEAAGTRLAEAESRTDRWLRLEHHIPGLLATVSETAGSLRRIRREVDTQILEAETQKVEAGRQQEQAERLGGSVNELWDHVRTVRAEVMHELRLRTGEPDPDGAFTPDIVDKERIEDLATSGPLRLNLGCGHILLPEYVNVDMRALPGVDVVAKLDDLPFEEASLGEIHSAHVLEHFPPKVLAGVLLPYWRSLLRPDGVFGVIVPDGAAMVQGLANGTIPFADYAAVLMGEQEYEGDAHHSVFFPESLVDLLEVAGFVDVEVIAVGRPLDICLEMEVRARPGTG